MASGGFFAASHSVSAEEQARIDPGPAPVLWPNATGSLDFYNDQPSEEPASGSQAHLMHLPHYPTATVGYGGYDDPGSDGSAGSSVAGTEVDADAAAIAAASESEPGPEEPAAADLDGSPVAPVVGSPTAHEDGHAATSLLQTRTHMLVVLTWHLAEPRPSLLACIWMPTQSG